MRTAYTISAVGHAAVLLWSVLTLVVRPYHADSTQALPIDVISTTEFSQMTNGAKNAPQAEHPKPVVDKVAEATRIVREREPGLAVDGPLQYDAAAIASVAQNKRPSSAVAGRATVFVFPDLDTGNTTYKAVQRSAHVVSVGPMLQGLRKPVNDLSRGALVDDIVYTIALTAVQATQGSTEASKTI